VREVEESAATRAGFMRRKLHCATQTNWDLECRAGMCSLVQSEPNNDHCTHAFGVDECLDKVTPDH
jgi:hypothetical protein